MGSAWVFVLSGAIWSRIVDLVDWEPLEEPDEEQRLGKSSEDPFSGW